MIENTSIYNKDKIVILFFELINNGNGFMLKMTNNVFKTMSDYIKSGQSILVGGFGLVGAPLTLIDMLTKLDVKDLTIVSNNLGEQGKGLGELLNQNKIKKGIGSYFTGNPDVGIEIELKLLPQGTLAEALREAEQE